MTGSTEVPGAAAEGSAPPVSGAAGASVPPTSGVGGGGRVPRASASPVLSVRGLRVSSSHTELLHGVSFDIAPGERVGLIGESGSGKSLTATAVMGLLPDTLEVSGSIRLGAARPCAAGAGAGAGAGDGAAGADGSGDSARSGGSVELVGASDAALSALRGWAMAMVFQEPMTALNPLMRAGAQVAEIMTRHRMLDARAARARAVELLAQVQLADPAEAALAFPHQLSGGQRQRVMLAMAMANDPGLLLCDEPTTALDVTVQAEVLRLIGALVADRGASLLFITHDIAVVAEVCERVLVMYRGEIVEDGPVAQVLTAPRHPYTRGLIAASDLSAVDERGRLRTGVSPGEGMDALGGADAAGVAGAADAAGAAGRSIRRPAAARVTAPAANVPALESTPVPHRWRTSDDERIVFTEAVSPDVVDPPADADADAAAHAAYAHPAGAEPLIRVRDLSRQYRRRGSRLFGAAPVVHGLREVSFDVRAGQRFGIVGESGSGKSTLMRILCALDRPTSGTVEVRGQDIAAARERQLREFRSHVQIVFQDPMGSLDPRMTVRQIVAEPLRGVSRQEVRDRVEAQLAAVGLSADVMDRHPHQFSGGQRQRISIARALITRPSVLIADEAVSALDVSVRAQVLNLLADLVEEYELTLVFVSHDLGVIRHSCDTVAVLSNGRFVEAGPTAQVYDDPRHPYTQRLVSATPSLDQLARRSR